MSLRRLILPLLLLGLAGAAGGAADDRPRLIVLLVVDQMRADYLERFGSQWTRGLRRLIERGAVYRQAAYTYFGTLTCAGHATIATGVTPSTHGIVLDGWWDKEADRRVPCTQDPSAAPITHDGSEGRGQNGPAPFRVPTLADELRVQLPLAPRIASFAVKSRAAIVMAGQRGDAVAWFDAGDRWTTSTAYTKGPIPFLSRFVREHPVEADLNREWRPSLPLDAYVYREGGNAAGFRHLLAGAPGEADAAFYTAWKTSPMSDEYVVRMGLAALEALDLGRRSTVDYLALGFSGADYIGHEYGPRSLEVQDEFVRIDAALGDLFDRLDATVGPDRYVVALSADHGVAPIPEWAVEQGFDAGRIVRGDMVEHVNGILTSLWGPGKYATGMTHIEFYFAPGVYERLQQEPSAMAAVLEGIADVPGVGRVYRSEDLAAGRFTDAMSRQVMASFFPGRSGDLVIIPKPYWYTWNRGADHGTGYQYDARVPLILMGHGIRAGTYLQEASPTDIAPTLAFLSGVTLARTDGRVLVEALAAAETPAAPTAAGRPSARP